MSFSLQLVASRAVVVSRLAHTHNRLQPLRSLHSVLSACPAPEAGASKQQQQTSRNTQPLLQKFNHASHHHQQSRSLMKLWKERTLRAMYWRSRRFDKVPEKAFVRSEFQDWSYSAEVAAFAARLGEPQLTEAALTRAFTHRSFVSAQQAKQAALGITDVQLNLEDNAELVAEGRRLIENYVRPYLRYHLRSAPEECIESVTQYLLSEAVLAEVSKWIGCVDLIFCEELPPLPSTLADTVPAVVATLSRASGQSRAEHFLVDFLLTYLNGADLLEVWPLHSMDVDLDSYLRLTGSVASKGTNPTEPRILRQSAVGTLEACYVVGIYSTSSDHQLLGEAPGESLPIAKRMAELDAFRRLFGLTVGEVRLSFGERAYKLDLAAFEGRPNFSMLRPSSSATSSSAKSQSAQA